MNKRLTFLFCIFFFATSQLSSQIDIYGQVSSAFVKTNKGDSQFIINNGHPTFLWRLDLFLDAYIVENVTAYMNVRVAQDEIINIDYLAVRIANISPLKFNIQAGKFDMPFGNLLNRRFPKDNFVFGLPLLYQYQTSLMSNYLYYNTQTFLENRGLGGTQRTPSSLPHLDRGIYGTGVMIFGAAGIFDYFVAVMNGTVSNTGAYTGSLNINNNLGKLIRLTMTPLMGLTFGGSFSWGSYLHDDVSPHLPPGSEVEDYRQLITGLDVEYSRGHLQFFAQGIYNIWEYPGIADDLKSTGYYAEAKYTLFPRLFIAGRINQLFFSKISNSDERHRWEYNVSQYEAGTGIAITRNALVKLVFRGTVIHASEPRNYNLGIIQLVAAF